MESHADAPVLVDVDLLARRLVQERGEEAGVVRAQLLPRHRTRDREGERVAVEPDGPDLLRLENGSEYRGPLGRLFATGLSGPTTMSSLPGQKSGLGEAPVHQRTFRA